MKAVHRTRGSVVQHQRKQLGPGVVADRIHHPLAFGDQCEIEIGDKDALAAGQRRHQMIAFR